MYAYRPVYITCPYPRRSGVRYIGQLNPQLSALITNAELMRELLCWTNDSKHTKPNEQTITFWIYTYIYWNLFFSELYSWTHVKNDVKTRQHKPKQNQY